MKTKIKPKKCFLITIEITTKEWDFNVGDRIVIPVFSNHIGNARSKFENKHWGSEYPSYNFISIVKENWLFYSVQ